MGVGIDVEKNDIRKLNSENEIYFNFSYAALKLLGKNLYSNAANAISELVANALDAKAKEVYVYIDMSDKEHSIIEIIDNGSGMDYSDLAEKYVWIGRNKRNDSDLSETEKNAIMGRKGIGKLAALYLSNQYYIFTRKDKLEQAWEVNLSVYDDWDMPKLDRLEKAIQLVNADVWNTCPNGTALKLENVDLRRNGEQKIEALRRVFADFYLLDSLQSSIYVAVKTKKDQEIKFEPVEKKIAYKNFYALFDNSGLNIASNMRESIEFEWASAYEHIANEPRETQRLDSKKFHTSGTFIYQKEDGTKLEKKYSMIGWIGVHATIEPKNAVDENFVRNSIYQPNRLRLYVRNKMAVADYFTISPSTQAMSNYIEGEITFDILDDDDMPDIATSSRQDFMDDERIQLLKDIVDPILARLFSLRNKIGNEITQENKAYELYLREEEKRKREKEEQARAEAEEQARQAEEKAEQARRDKEKAEEKYAVAKTETKKYQAQANTIFSALSEDQKSFSAKTHLVKTNALTIRNGVTTLAKKIGIDKYKELSAISVAADKILSALKYSALAKFDIEDEYITEDLFAFCHEYLLNVLKKQYFDIDIETNIKGEYNVRFNPQYVSLVLDNLVANSEKSNSTAILVDMYCEGDKKKIVIADNGDGFKDVDTNRIFEFGFSNTGGTGIGLYNIKTVIHKMGGEVFSENNGPRGAKFTITLQ